MLKSFEIKNYKSIEHMTLDLGRVNVLIGENGAGKSNILEAVALAGAAQADKLDNEFLASRGIRAVAPKLMRSAFEMPAPSKIELTVQNTRNIKTDYVLSHDDKPYSSWNWNINNDSTASNRSSEELRATMERLLGSLPKEEISSFLETLKGVFEQATSTERGSRSVTASREASPAVVDFLQGAFPVAAPELGGFVTYSPENTALRSYSSETQIEPLGVRGEGLLRFLAVLEKEGNEGRIGQIKNGLKMLGWFTDFTMIEDDLPRMGITDCFLPKDMSFDQRSANEGFLYIAFYFALFCSDLTPKLFAVDNIDASLNPKLCSAMVTQLVAMARHNDKQVILTTHNPAVLDGLDLNDDEQRLFVIQRDRHGRTQALRVSKPRYEGKPRKLSELFMAGLIGGLPKSF